MAAPGKYSQASLQLPIVNVMNSPNLEENEWSEAIGPKELPYDRRYPTKA